ncbi:MAG: O-antigen ligase family protein [Syntrophomonadaceae bacterium]|nr:O-antigen ligase family protein [Syntrophomonadaceae bacterium]
MSKRKAKQRREQQKILDRQNNETLCWRLLLAILLLVPLILGLAQFEFFSPTMVGSVNDSGEKAEVFVTYKWYVLMGLSFLLLLAYSWRLLRLKEDVRPSYANLPLLLFTACLLLSLLFAPYKQIALFGMHDMREGASTWLCYLLIFFVALQSDLPARLEKWLLIVLGVLVGINAVMGALLFYGINIMEHSWVANIIMFGQAGQFSSSGEIFGTMTNPNYLSPLGACMGIFFMVYGMMTDRWWKAGLAGLAAVLSFSVLLTSLSGSGFVSFTAAAVIALPVALWLARNKIQAGVSAVAVLALCALLMVTYAGHNPRIYSESFGFYQLIWGQLQTQEAQAAEETLPPTDEGQAAANSAPEAVGPAVPYAMSDTIIDPELLPVKSTPTFGSNRGYIWRTSWQLSLDKPLLGHGLDTLAFYFPYGSQHHYANMGNVVASKPHNMYLGVSFGLGLPALLILLVMLGLIMWRERPQAARSRDALPAALWCAIVCFLGQFLVNDSSLGTSVPFWLMLGLLISEGRKAKANIQ